MASNITGAPAETLGAAKSPEARNLVLGEAANEFVFAVVGHIGSGTSEVAKSFRDLLSDEHWFQTTTILKAREVIQQWAEHTGNQFPAEGQQASIETADAWQNLGDEMRMVTNDHAAVARELIKRIRQTRASLLNVEVVDGEPVVPDGAGRAYILDSIRHPAEVNLLRHIYQDAFVLIGVVCDQDVRLSRLQKKLNHPRLELLQQFMKRDEKDIDHRYGQQVAKAFQLADFYVDNTPDRYLYTEGGDPLDSNPDWEINDKLQRLVRIVTHEEVERPEISETAMHHAYSAQMRSACLSRQVGAALVDRNGNLLSTGTNEVPKAGGGVYGESFNGDIDVPPDHRCVARPHKYCSSTREQNVIIEDILEDVAAIHPLNPQERAKLRRRLKDGRVGDTIEFSRAVHAEMDALLSASRSGGSTMGARLFVTTFPCHYCARHIISAGVDEVQYIEPYSKSLALSLHSDAIQQRLTGWTPPSTDGTTVLFRPFTGVAPRLYRRAFLKERELKNADTGNFEISEPEWGAAWHLRRQSYVQLEAQLSKAG
jgi:deoxycytidylate deaminase